jgi:hypothetical protein
MGLGAHAEIGGEQESQIELIDRLVDGAGAMVGGQGVLDREPLGGPRIPGRHGEAIEFGTVLGWRRVDRYREVERAARPVGAVCGVVFPGVAKGGKSPWGYL